MSADDGSRVHLLKCAPYIISLIVMVVAWRSCMDSREALTMVRTHYQRDKRPHIVISPVAPAGSEALLTVRNVAGVPMLEFAFCLHNAGTSPAQDLKIIHVNVGVRFMNADGVDITEDCPIQAQVPPGISIAHGESYRLVGRIPSSSASGECDRLEQSIRSGTTLPVQLTVSYRSDLPEDTNVYSSSGTFVVYRETEGGRKAITAAGRQPE